MASIGLFVSVRENGGEPVEAFYAVAQGTRLRIVQEALSGAWEALLDERVDIVVAVGDGPSGGGYVSKSIGRVDFVFTVAPSHPLAAVDRPLGKADLQPHRAVAVADSARRLVPRTVGLLFGQDALTVPDIASKFRFQLAGLGFGFLPESLARPAIKAGLLVEKSVDEPRAPETFHVAWRSDESGAALDWWRERLRRDDVSKRLLRCVGSSRDGSGGR